MVDEAVRDYHSAKHKACDRLGLDVRSTPLPTNREIESAVALRLRLFRGHSLADDLQRIDVVLVAVGIEGLPLLPGAIEIGLGLGAQRLLEGIGDLGERGRQGVDIVADGVTDRYLAAPTAAQIETAVVARVYLLVRSLQEVAGYQNAKTYQLGSKAIAAKNDGFLRRVFTTTVLIRNAVLPVS